MIKLSITVNGRQYPIKVGEKDVEGIREMESEINARIQKFSSEYADAHREDTEIMALLSIVFELKKNDSKTSQKLLSEKLDSIDSLLQTIV